MKLVIEKLGNDMGNGLFLCDTKSKKFHVHFVRRLIHSILDCIYVTCVYYHVLGNCHLWQTWNIYSRLSIYTNKMSVNQTQPISLIIVFFFQIAIARAEFENHILRTRTHSIYAIDYSKFHRNRIKFEMKINIHMKAHGINLAFHYVRAHHAIEPLPLLYFDNRHEIIRSKIIIEFSNGLIR